jgi:hypothetical protein
LTSRLHADFLSISSCFFCQFLGDFWPVSQTPCFDSLSIGQQSRVADVEIPTTAEGQIYMLQKEGHFEKEFAMGIVYNPHFVSKSHTEKVTELVTRISVHLLKIEANATLIGVDDDNIKETEDAGPSVSEVGISTATNMRPSPDPLIGNQTVVDSLYAPAAVAVLEAEGFHVPDAKRAKIRDSEVVVRNGYLQTFFSALGSDFGPMPLADQIQLHAYMKRAETDQEKVNA